MSSEWESESQTRRRRIDPKKAAQGWQVADFDASVPSGTTQFVSRPEIREQIAERGVPMLKLADSIASHLAEATAQAERTAQAILASAFRGEPI